MPGDALPPTLWICYGGGVLPSRWIGAACVVCTVGCAAISGFDDLEKVGAAPDTIDTTDSAAVDSTGGSDTAEPEVPFDSAPIDAPPFDAVTGDAAGCPSGRGPTMVSVSGYCIDSTEVTVGQYAAFLTAKGFETITQPAVCSWNTSFSPSPWPQSGDTMPVYGADWCDAWAFCAWAGKRLCGKIGGGANPHGSYGDATSSQWFHACSANGTRVFPYGNAYQANACQGGDIKPNRLVPVGSKSTCVGGFPDVFDMSGNVYEWEDSCTGTAGSGDMCRIRGGGYLSPESYMRCALDRSYTRNARELNVGFRCCY